MYALIVVAIVAGWIALCALGIALCRMVAVRNADPPLAQDLPPVESADDAQMPRRAAT